MQHDTRPLWQRYTLPPLTDEILPTLEETVTALAKDEIKSLMEYQQLVGRYPIPDISVRVAMTKLITFIRDIQAGNWNYSQFRLLIAEAKVAKESAFDGIRFMYPDIFDSEDSELRLVS